MQINTPEGILYVFRGRFMQQNSEDISLDGDFIRPFGDNTLQVLSAPPKLNFCVRYKICVAAGYYKRKNRISTYIKIHNKKHRV